LARVAEVRRIAVYVACVAGQAAPTTVAQVDLDVSFAARGWVSIAVAIPLGAVDQHASGVLAGSVSVGQRTTLPARAAVAQAAGEVRLATRRGVGIAITPPGLALPNRADALETVCHGVRQRAQTAALALYIATSAGVGRKAVSAIGGRAAVVDRAAGYAQLSARLGCATALVGDPASAALVRGRALAAIQCSAATVRHEAAGSVDLGASFGGAGVGSALVRSSPAAALPRRARPAVDDIGAAIRKGSAIGIELRTRLGRASALIELPQAAASHRRRAPAAVDDVRAAVRCKPARRTGLRAALGHACGGATGVRATAATGLAVGASAALDFTATPVGGGPAIRAQCGAGLWNALPRSGVRVGRCFVVAVRRLGFVDIHGHVARCVSPSVRCDSRGRRGVLAGPPAASGGQDPRWGGEQQHGRGDPRAKSASPRQVAQP